MKKTIFWLLLIALLFVGASRAYALISDVPLSQELKSADWGGGDFVFYNVTKVAETLTAFAIGTGDPEVDQKLGPTAFNSAAGLVGLVYANPVASSFDYLADVGKRLKIVSPAFAQTGGVGFEGLAPLLPIWKISRNIAYAFFVIIFVGMGFAIMFRVKLNPQTVITVQNAIPKVVIALILVTFSYAIAGLLIDLVYVVLSVGVLALNPLSEQIDVSNAATGLSFWEGLGYMFGGAFRTAVRAPGGPLAAGGVAFGVVAALVGLGGATAGTAALAGGIAIVILLLIIAVILIWAIIRLFLALVRSYINIIIAVIFGPLQIMLGVLPGEQFGFKVWFRNLFANLMVFPAVAIFMILGWSLTNEAGPNWTPPVMGRQGTRALTAIIGFGMLLMLPKIPDIVREALQVKPFPFGTAIGESLGPLRMAGRYGGVAGLEAAYQRGARPGGAWDTAAYPTRSRMIEAVKTAVQKAIGG